MSTIDALIAVREAVAARENAREAADQRLRNACREAIQAGAPQTLVAETAGVDRSTVKRWIA